MRLAVLCPQLLGEHVPKDCTREGQSPCRAGVYLTRACFSFHMFLESAEIQSIAFSVRTFSFQVKLSPSVRHMERKVKDSTVCYNIATDFVQALVRLH